MSVEPRNKKARNELVDGVDSGQVSESVKRQLLSDGLGICAAPSCNNRIHRYNTRLGECAHIIPRKVGSHPREDYLTPLEDRKKGANLLYLCEMHHPIIDNSDLAEQYTADVLRKWKQEHEAWAVNVKKNSPFIPAFVQAELKKLNNDFQEKFAQQAELAANILGKLLDTCHDLLLRNRVAEARSIMAQVDVLLLDSSNEDLIQRNSFLWAIVDIKSEKNS
jgi:hypothetical protein